jgi:hypothetical protein
MTISKQLKNVTGGAELTKPELTANYLIAATIGIVVLMAAWHMGDLIFSRGSTFVQGRVAGVPTTDFKAALGIV